MRYLLLLPPAILANLLLLLCMQSLVTRAVQSYPSGPPALFIQFIEPPPPAPELTPEPEAAEPPPPPKERPPPLPNLRASLPTSAPRQAPRLAPPPPLPIPGGLPYLGEYQPPLPQAAPARAAETPRAAPQPTLRIPPLYPLRARREGIAGRVLVEFQVDEQGRVQDARVLEAEPEGVFERAVLSVLPRWRYDPKAFGNQRRRQEIIFRLEDR